MRDLKFVLKQGYDCSRALVVGINKYKNVSPLGYAVSDAEEVKNILINELGFSSDNVLYLVDEGATKGGILRAFHTFTSDDVRVDDRLFVFFAGHGHTRTGFRGEVGYLVPYDADMNDSSSFIRWDELTRNAELIRAKHVLFVMDACYGGLAVNRDLQSGSSRFLKDMYQRFSRQVITAGKADEVVSDSGGPLPNHSVFTGHFIEGVRGKAANEYGVITASGLMAYVYAKVANDMNSEQTPHYGQFDGDGDFIFTVPAIDEGDGKRDLDEIVSFPYVDEARVANTLGDKVSYLKDLLSAQRSQIKLHDFIAAEVKGFLLATGEDSFAVSGGFSDQGLLDRISSYEQHAKDLGAIIAVLSYWGSGDELNVLRKIISRSSDRLVEAQGGVVVWLNLRWYPLLLLLYYAGIAAVESKNYHALAVILYSKLGGQAHGGDESYFAIKLSDGILELTRGDVFKRIPGHERNYTPESEYLFKNVQPLVESLFFIGKGYESVFDEFEVLYALVVADLRSQAGHGTWGPIGRFGWKHSRQAHSPFTKILNEAGAHKENWPPIKAGMFGGSFERFEQVAAGFKRVLDDLRWY